MLDPKDRTILVAQLADSFISKAVDFASTDLAKICDVTFTEAVLYGLKVLEATETQLSLESANSTPKIEEEPTTTELEPWMKWVQVDNHHLLVAHRGSNKEMIIVHFFTVNGHWYINNPDLSTYLEGDTDTEINVEHVKKSLQRSIPIKGWSEWNESLKIE